MQLDQRFGVAAVVMLAALHLFLDTVSAADVVTKFEETEETFANPGQGWMTMRRLPDGPGRFPYSVAYFRLNWEDLEPAEGQYNWHLIDEALEAWAKRETRIAFRVMTTNAHSQGYYCSPKWLFDAGCRYHEYVAGGDDITAGGSRITRVEPDYGDPLYLTKHAQFLSALAERYDGDPRIEFIDIGSYGIWGEWHTKHPQPWPIRRQIIDMYLEGFSKTTLASMSDDAEALAYALAHGTGFRRDGVGSPWHEANWIGSEKYARVEGFADHWKRAPVIFEWYGPYDYLVHRGWSLDAALAFMAANHVTFVNDNVGKVPADELPKLERLARRAGYRFVVRDVSHPEEVAPGKTLRLRIQGANVGVGKLYRPYPLVLYLRDASGAIVSQETQPEIDATRWLPGDWSVVATLSVPGNLPAGDYSVGLALTDPVSHRPAIRLAIDAPQAERLYHLSSVRVQPEA